MRNTKFAFVFIIVLCALCLSLTGCRKDGGQKKKRVLTIYTWAEMFPQELLDSFTKETGIEINYQNFDYDETMLARLVACEGKDYDFVIADDYIIEQAIELNLVSEIDRSKISTWENINPVFQGQFYDPGDKYTVPCGAGIIQIVYRPASVGFKITGYRDLWDERLKGKVGIIGNPRVINGIVFKMNGFGFNTEDTDAIKAVSSDYEKLVPNIRVIKDMFLNDDIVSGEIDAGLFYSSQAFTAVTADSSLETVLPKEGLGYGIMGGFIPSNAPDKDAAHAFIEFLNRPENAASWFEFLGYFCTNKAAEQFIDPSVKNLITIPESFDSKSMDMIQNVPGEIASLHEEIWQAFLNACN